MKTKSRIGCVAGCVAALSAPAGVMGQPVISSTDLFNQPGQYYRAYANIYEPMELTGGTAYIVPSDLIGSAGADQFWDFSNGPKDRVFRFDYVTPAGLSEAADFPDAKVAERKTDERDNSVEYLFFTQTPGVGRTVYGYYAPNPLFTPSNVFVPPIMDFPDRIFFGLEWSTSTAYENTLSLVDPEPDPEFGGGGFELAAQTTLSSKFKVDAHGTIVLPDELGAFGPGLRINEEVTIDIAVDLGEGQYEHIETDYTRNYYWVMPGRGIVAQLNSTQAASPPPEKFPRATAFLRMFETNKKLTAVGGCDAPAPVSDLKVRVSNSNLLLTWSKAECATKYRVEYAERPFSSTWTALGDPIQTTFWQGENTRSGNSRFYRVVSLK